MTTTFHTSLASKIVMQIRMLSRLPIEAALDNAPIPGYTIMLLETLVISCDSKAH